MQSYRTLLAAGVLVMAGVVFAGTELLGGSSGSSGAETVPVVESTRYDKKVPKRPFWGKRLYLDGVLKTAKQYWWVGLIAGVLVLGVREVRSYRALGKKEPPAPPPSRPSAESGWNIPYEGSAWNPTLRDIAEQDLRWAKADNQYRRMMPLLKKQIVLEVVIMEMVAADQVGMSLIHTPPQRTQQLMTPTQIDGMWVSIGVMAIAGIVWLGWAIFF